jgi:hypothetical protein
MTDARAVRALRDEGRFADARREARARAEALIDDLPDGWTPPGDETPLPTDPRGLAALVRRI